MFNFSFVCFFVAVSILPIFVEAFPYTRLPEGCYTIEGSAECSDGSEILKNATVVLMERDDWPFKDDVFGTIKGFNYMFSFKNVCITDQFGPHVEVYLRFYDICKGGVINRSGFILTDDFVKYFMRDGVEDAEVIVG